MNRSTEIRLEKKLIEDYFCCLDLKLAKKIVDYYDLKLLEIEKSSDDIDIDYVDKSVGKLLSNLSLRENNNWRLP